jgi:aquaporin Z
MRKYITEFIGTFFLVLTIGLTVASGSPLAPIAIGASLMVMIYAGGHISGAHYNPAVTLAVLVRGRISVPDALIYSIVQILGAVVAAFLVKYFAGDALVREAAPMADTIKGLVAEILGTFALAYVILNVATAKATSGNSFYGLAIGFTVTAMAFALGSFSGGAFNPAVAVGVTLMHFASWTDIWVFIVGCFAGGALAGVVFNMNNPDDKDYLAVQERAANQPE